MGVAPGEALPYLRGIQPGDLGDPGFVRRRCNVKIRDAGPRGAGHRRATRLLEPSYCLRISLLK